MTDAEIVAMYLELKDAELTGIRAHVSSDTVRRLVRAAGHPLAPRSAGGRKRRPLALTDAEICDRWMAGQSVQEIARAAGATTLTVRYRLKAAGMPLRPFRKRGRAP